MNKSLNVACALAFSDPAGRLYGLDVIIKYNPLRLIVIYAPNDHAELTDLFLRIETFLTTSGSLSGRLECRS